MALAVYAGLGLLVAFTRFAVPNPRPQAADQADAGPISAEPADARAEPDLALAA